MYYKQIIDRSSKSLNLLFAGWGMDANPFQCEQSGLWRLANGTFNTAVVYDYTDLTFCSEWIDRYDSIRLIAWSMGVWAVEQVSLPNVVEAIAVNGTGVPVDDEFGIHTAIFEGTLAGLSEESLLAFYRRMCGTRVALSDFLSVRPARSIDSLRVELAAIGRGAQGVSPYPMSWTKAIVGEQDRIFPADHQLRYWNKRGVPTEVLSGTHLL